MTCSRAQRSRRPFDGDRALEHADGAARGRHGALQSCSTSMHGDAGGFQRLELDVKAIDDQRRQAQRDLVEQQQLRVSSSSARPIAVACCSPPDNVPARLRRRSLRLGKASMTASSVHAPVRPAERASNRFSSTVSRANNRRPSGTSATPSAARA